MMLIDSHCHLDRIDLTPFKGDLTVALKAANALEVGHMINVSVDWETFPKVLAIAEQYDCVSASVGVHPTETNCIEPTVDMLVEAAKHPKVVAIGETGLDYFRLPPGESTEIQHQRFRTHIRAAKQSDKPLIIHTRQACDDTIRLLREENNGPGVFHCFTEDWAMAKRGLELGMYISFSGIVTFKNAQALRDVAKQVPLDRLLVETDTPYLTPVPHRGTPNQPGYTRFVAECIAELRGMSYPELRDITTANVLTLFKLKVRT
jgi:TatD DNase family protein